jgi:Uncharacterized protein family UPF0029
MTGENELASLDDAVDDFFYNESLQRALADLEMVMAAYPDETSIVLSSSSSGSHHHNNDTAASPRAPSSFPLHFRLHMSPSCYFDLSMRSGYPSRCNIEIASMRCDGKNTANKERMEAAATAIRKTARMCLHLQEGNNNNGNGNGDDDIVYDNDAEAAGGGEEGGLACCAAAMEAWNNHTTTTTPVTTHTTVTTTTTTSSTTETTSRDDIHLPMDENDDGDGNVLGNFIQQQQQEGKDQHRSCHYYHESYKQGKKKNVAVFPWITGQPLVDRKSTFLAHACPVSCEADVKIAMQQLLDSHSKYRRATHNMVRKVVV